MNTKLSWNAIYTRRNCEAQVSKLLEKKGIAYYYAQNQESLASHQKKAVYKPLFESIIFVQIPLTVSLLSLKQLPNVTNVLYWQQSPAVFPATEINLLRNFMETNPTVEITKTNVSIKDVTGAQQISQHSFSADNVHTIHLPSIGYYLSAKAEPVTNIKLVRKSDPVYRTTDGLSFILGLKTNKFE